MFGDDLTVRRAVLLIAAVTVAVGVAGGLLMRAIDPQDFASVGAGLWWAVQTITTVGYGDKVPTSTESRIVAVLVMACGLGFMSVITAAITAAFVESSRKRRRVPEEITLEHIAQRLDELEAQLVHHRADRES